MSHQPRPVVHPLGLPSNTGGCRLDRSLFFAPIRFCGRQWESVRSDSNDKISQTVFKVLAKAVLACAIILAGIPAVAGALIFSPDYIPPLMDYCPEANFSMLKRDTSDEEIAERIRKLLNDEECECSVQVQSVERRVSAFGDRSENIHRNVTLINPSDTAISRFTEVLKYHFYNKDVSSLENLYLCMYGMCLNTHGKGGFDKTDRLKTVLALHGSVTFHIPFDFAYVNTELGRG
jgi:hypothetical protein